MYTHFAGNKHNLIGNASAALMILKEKWLWRYPELLATWKGMTHLLKFKILGNIFHRVTNVLTNTNEKSKTGFIMQVYFNRKCVRVQPRTSLGVK